MIESLENGKWLLSELVLANQNIIFVFFASLFVYLNADRIVRNTAVFFVGGSILGVCSSLIGFVYMLQRLIPRSLFTLPVYLGGWPLSLYVYYQAYKNIGNIMRNYPTYLTSYIGVCMLISFAICYRMGPPTDPRTLNLMKWFLQLCSFLGIYWSCQHKELAITVITLLATWNFWVMGYSTTQSAATKSMKWIKELIFGPDPRRLLSEYEYVEEADIYTKLELDQLRNFCRNSPPTSNWKMVSRLHNPRRSLEQFRMASFINGDVEHVTPGEQSLHSSVAFQDDEDDFDPIRDDEFDGYITDD